MRIGTLALALATVAAVGFVALRSIAPRAEGRTGGSGGPPLRVRVVTYNTWMLPFSFAQETPQRLARMPAALRGLDADVIGLQEVWVPDARRAIVEGLAPDYTAAKSDRGGLLLLSRFPVREERFTPYAIEEGTSLVERLAGKGALDAVLDTPAGPLRVVLTHLIAFNHTLRDRQITFLLDRIVNPRRGLPLVVLGDLNLVGGEDAYMAICSCGLQDVNPPHVLEDGSVALVGRATWGGWPRSPGGDGYSGQFDHAFFSSGDCASVRCTGYRVELNEPETALSDHNAVVAEVEIANTKR